MKYLNLQNIEKSYIEEKPLIQDLSLLLSEGDVCGIIGRNGEGKTTLLKIIAGEIHPDNGQVIISPDTIIGYHTQFLQIQNVSQTIEEYVLSTISSLFAVYEQMSRLQNELTEKEVANLMQLQAKFDELGGWVVLSDIHSYLIQLGLDKFKPEDQVSKLSGGQKTRLQLVRILIQNPDILLLDEPTNHLDSSAINWLEEFIKSRKGITIIVSHDRAFLNNTTNKILEIEKGSTKLYFGNYDEYKSQKDKLIEKNEIAYKLNSRKIKRLQEAVNVKKSQAIYEANYKIPDKKKYGKFARGGLLIKAGKKARIAKMYQKRVNSQIEHNQALKPANYRKMIFKVESAPSTGDFVLRISDYDLKIEDRKLVENINLEVGRGVRMAILGENGSGKTTLLKRMIEVYAITSTNMVAGLSDNKLQEFREAAFKDFSESELQKFKFGGNILLGYYSQEHEGVDQSLNVIDDFRTVVQMTEVDAANYLFNMTFAYHQLKQKVSDLSQGEKSKLALAKLLVQEHNFLILDEPTNHLDIASREVLEKALQYYEGTILCVSHDRYFLQNINVEKKLKIESHSLVCV